jgi:SAM-dependent methyltransferase
MTTDWEERYRQADTPWDKGVAHPAVVRWLAEHPGRMTGAVLVPGCGLGHDARAIAAAEPAAAVVGLDVAASAIAAAAGLAGGRNLTFRQGDLFDLPPELHGGFDWVWEHTCFCAIDVDRRDDYVAAVAAAVRPRGHLLGVFYLDPYRGDHRPGGGPPHGCTSAELAERFGRDGRFRILADDVPSATYPERDGRERLVLMERSPARPH